MAMLGRFSADAFLIIAMLFSGELFPTMLRSTSIFICAMLSRLSAIFAPFLIFAGIKCILLYHANTYLTI